MVSCRVAGAAAPVRRGTRGLTRRRARSRSLGGGELARSSCEFGLPWPLGGMVRPCPEEPMPTPHRAHVPAILAVLLLAFEAHAASDATKCVLGRYKAAGKYEYCFQKALSRDGFVPIDPELAKCRAKWESTWARLALSTPS